MARILFEQKLNGSDSQFLKASDKIDILIENAKFEEMSSNSMKARKIYEQLDTEIAPGLVKATLARINFEKRENNMDKAKELYFNAFQNSLKKNDGLAVTVIATQYARFLSQKCNEHGRALDIMEQAVSNT